MHAGDGPYVDPICGIDNPVGTHSKTPQPQKCLQGFELLQWALLDSNQRPPACKAGALTKLS